MPIKYFAIAAATLALTICLSVADPEITQWIIHTLEIWSFIYTLAAHSRE